MPDQNRGLYEKYTVKRKDGSNKHRDCKYFVIDLNHDDFAIPALEAYANACLEKYPILARDLRSKINLIKYRESEKSDKITLSGNFPEDPSIPGAPAPIDSKTGMHKDYYILSDEELSKGYVRPVRTTYVHKYCLTHTTMSLKIAQTYARDPKFYGSTFCVHCRKHYPVKNFLWEGTDEEVGN